jgi:hypothetical protein
MKFSDMTTSELESVATELLAALNEATSLLETVAKWHGSRKLAAAIAASRDAIARAEG